jgi:hypothetical protein
MSGSFREVFRSLLLPVAVDRETEAINAAITTLDGFGVTEVDRPDWLKLYRDAWRSQPDQPDANFRLIVEAAIRAGDTDYGERLAREYFSLHSGLRATFELSTNEASAFLSHSVLVGRLSDRQRMSSAQIAKLLTQRDTRVGFSRQSVEKLVTKLATKRSFERDDVERVFLEDTSLEENQLADSDLVDASKTVGRIANDLGIYSNIGDYLLVLANLNDVSRYSPYIQILHYQCTIAEFFDHALTDIYEFSPRSNRVRWLVEQYPDALVNAANPFLNNAKSVERLNMGWARSKMRQDRYPGACALVEILTALENLGFAARRELASWIRIWIHRVMRYARPLQSIVPDRLDQQQIDLLINRISGGETGTAGIIEQRLVDATTSVLHARADGWIPRGLGDAVNATNVSKKKVGDCDFQNPATRSVVAYEAHGGPLTEVYLQGHVQTLPKALLPRQEEWSGFSDPSEWSIEIQFIAHEIHAQVPDPIIIDGTRVSFRLRTYQELEAECAGLDLIDSFESLVTNPLNEKRTPTRARDRLLELIA